METGNLMEDMFSYIAVIKAYFEQLFRNSPEAIAIIDNDLRISKVNDAFEDMFKYKNKSIIGKCLDDIIVPDYMWEEAVAVNKEILNKKLINKETLRKTKNGDNVWVNLTVYPIYVEQVCLGFYTVYRNITERITNEAHIRRLAYIDSVTDLYNRRYFNEKLEEEITTAKVNNTTFAVLYIDICNFKNINDNLGYFAGDNLLKQFADSLKTFLCRDIAVARWGSDEFVLLLRNAVNVSDAEKLARKIVDQIKMPICYKELLIEIKVSIGIVMCPEHGQDIQGIISGAVLAMHKAREQSYNNYQVYDLVVKAEKNREFIVENSLQQAINKEEMFLVYQPIINISNNAIVYAEALLRWRNSTIGLVSPDEFIPIAEQKGHIVSLGEWVIKTACQQLGEWHKEGFTGLRLAINISVIQLEKEGFIDYINKCLRENELKADSLMLEITESISMNNYHARRQILERLKNMGISLAIDDFGTGFSSMGQLKQMSIDALKIDKSFIANIVTNKNDRNIVKAMLLLAEQLGLFAVAEGVETEEQLDILKRERCKLVQGYYFSKPLKTEAFKKYYKKKNSTFI